MYTFLKIHFSFTSSFTMSPASPAPAELPVQPSIEIENSPLAILQTVGDKRFNTLPDVAAYLKTLDAPTRYQYVSHQVEQLLGIQETADKYLEYINEFVKDDEAFEERMTVDPETWDKVREGAERCRKRRQKKDECVQKVFEKWGEENVRQHFGHMMDMGDSTWSKVRRIAMRDPFDVTVIRLRGAILWRIQNPAPGRDSKTLTPVGADFDSVFKHPERISGAVNVVSAGYSIGESGWLVPAERVLQIREESHEGDQESQVQKEQPSPESPLSSIPEELEEMDLDLDDRGATDNRNSGLRLSEGRFAEPPRNPPAHQIDSAHGMLEESEKDTVSDGVESDYETEGDRHQDKKRKRDSEKETEGSYKCGCDGRVARSFIEKCVTGKVVNPGAQERLVKRWAAYHTQGVKVCYHHGKNIASIIGLQIRILTSALLVERLLAYHEAILQSKTGDLRSGKETYSWFRMESRPARASDRLGPYKFTPREEEAFAITEQHQWSLREELGISSKAWNEIGSVVVSCFEWWSSLEYGGDREHLRGMTAMHVIHEEYEMYRAHLRMINTRPNYGWLRNMYYSLGQQLMRQDPRYYLIYCALRPDQNVNLVSYPYYAKYQHEGDMTFFRHIDINIKGLAKDARGANMIQGTVSIDDEYEDDCTMILPGMHNHTKEWEEVLEERGLSTEALVHRIQDTMFTKEDAARFGTQWTPQPCRSGQVRVTLPHLPHGAYGPAKRIRRTMLPWFCGLQKDLETLEVAEGGTWSDLSIAHRDLVAARLSPSGLPNRYGAIPFAFPAAVELEGLGALSDALVCRRRHDKVSVMQEKKALLLGTKEERERIISAWRQKAVNKVCEAFEKVREAEMERFGEKSYFRRRARGLSPAVSDSDPDASEEEIKGVAHGFEEPEVEE